MKKARSRIAVVAVVGATLTMLANSQASAADMPDLTPKLLSAKEVAAIVKNGKPVSLIGQTDNVDEGYYVSRYSEGASELDRYVLTITTSGPVLGPGGVKNVVDSTYKCQTTEKTTDKETVVCSTSVNVMASSTWSVPLGDVTWTIDVLSSRMLIDLATGKITKLTKTIIADEARDAAGLRNRLKAKTIG